MKIIYKKEARLRAILTLVASLGAFWLSYIWLGAAGDSYGIKGSDLARMGVFVYYTVNCILLFLIFVAQNRRLFNFHAILSLVLALSVFTSLFFPGFQGEESLFVETILLGIFLGAFYGGFILVPLFFVAIIINLVLGIKFLAGRVRYATEEENLAFKEKPKFIDPVILENVRKRKKRGLIEFGIGVLFAFIWYLGLVNIDHTVGEFNFLFLLLFLFKILTIGLLFIGIVDYLVSRKV